MCLFCTLVMSTIITGCQLNNSQKEKTGLSEEHEAYDGPDKAAAFEFMRTKDPVLGTVPTERLLFAMDQTIASKQTAPAFTSAFGSWIERGPNSDAVGPSSGNTRPNSDVAAGRVRAIMVDSADATKKTVWVASVAGGLWKTTDITTSPANWILVNDFLSNLAITNICQDPTNSNTMYFCTGEAFYNADAVNGVGVFKSTDHGVNWTQLATTSSFKSCTKILCDYQGNIYLATRGNGLRRSVNGGSTWTNITPTGMTNDICDLEINSTSAAGRLHVVAGIFTAQSYKYTDVPSTATSAAGWNAPATAFPSYDNRAEIAVKGNTLYALPADASNQVPTIYKSADGGANWAATTSQPNAGNWASGQGWYALGVDINPANTNECIIGGLDSWKTTDGGATWNQLSTWVGTTGQYVHADIHKILWYDAGNKLLFGCDGGVHYSANKGVTIRDRNTGLRVKQFYSCAAHPTNLNYFLAGAQDNGSHAFSAAGLGATSEVTGGDGCYVHIDQNQPQYQFTSYTFNDYSRSTNSGASWSNVTLSTSAGQFINPTDYDDVANIMYCSDAAGGYRRWTNPQTGSTSAVVSITAIGASNSVSAITVSPYTSNRIYLGTYSYNTSTGTPLSSTVSYVDAANTTASGSAGVNITAGLPTSGSVSCIAVGTTDNNLMVCYSNYGVNSIWVSSNAGTSWTSIEGNLPDMPVRWCMFAPGDNSKAIIATETGVWLTQALSAATTNWISSPTFPAVRTDMLQYRSADKMVIAATHGRGLWTQTAASILPLNNFILKGNLNGNTASFNWQYEDLPAGAIFDVEFSTDGIHFLKVASLQKGNSSNYSFKYEQPDAQNFYYRIKGLENSGNIKYSNSIRLFKNNNANKNFGIVKLYPNPTTNNLGINFNTTEQGMASYLITATGGQVVWRKQAFISFTGNSNITEDITSLQPGSYIFTIILNGKKTTQSFIKK